jgi:hypothetical protein
MKVFFDTNVYVAEATDFHSAMSLDVGRKKELVLPALGAERGTHGRQAADHLAGFSGRTSGNHPPRAPSLGWIAIVLRCAKIMLA